MKLASQLIVLLAVTAAPQVLPAQDAAPIVRSTPSQATTQSTGTTKPRPRPLTIEEIQKLQAAKAAARAAAGTKGAESTKPAAADTVAANPATATKPATAATSPIKPRPTASPGPHPTALSVAKPAVPVVRPASASATGTPVPPAPVAPTTGVLNRTTIVLDPAHGGSDNGSRLSDNLVEKDVTLALAFKLRSLLQARGFTVVLTRDSDAVPDSSPTPLTLDDRAGIANHSRAVACLLLHATASGSGVHLYHSELNPAAEEATTLPWLTAQAAWVEQSVALSGKITQSLTRASIPFVYSAASVRPVDSLTCPALVIELAPKGSDVSTLNDSSYQQSVAEAISGTLVFWKNQARPPQLAVPAALLTTEAQ